MKIDLTKKKYLNDGIAVAMRQADALRDYDKYASDVKEVNQMEEIKRAAGLISPAMDELNRIEEMRKITDVPDYMTSAADKMNLASTIGMTSPMLEEVKRMEEMRKSLTAPSGIAGMVIENMALQESRNDFLYPMPERMPVVDYAAIRPMPDPMRETNKNLKETKALQAKMAEHLEELVSQAKGTTDQNVKMIKLSTASLICTVVGIVLSTLVGVLSYYAGKSSSTPAVKVAPVVKPVPAPTVPARK
jgi:hypothetical protein